MVKSITLSFSRAVGTVDDGAFKVIAQQAGGDPTVIVTWNAARTAAALTFSDSLILGGSLQDGRFSLVMDSTKIHDVTGGLLDGDGNGMSGGTRAADALLRLFGDSDGDVDNLDLFRYRQSFGLMISSSIHLAISIGVTALLVCSAIVFLPLYERSERKAHYFQFVARDRSEGRRYSQSISQNPKAVSSI